MRSLSPRLGLIAGKVPEGSRLADIGCDHANLCISLVKSGKIASAVACDIRSGPLKSAEKNVMRHGCNRAIALRLSSGFACVKRDEFDCAVVAGMGGEVIIEILSAMPYPPPANALFLLQPMTRASALRAALPAIGYRTSDEALACEGKKLYLVISAHYTGEKALGSVSLEESLFGSILPSSGHTLWPEYKNRVLSRLLKEYLGIMKSGAGSHTKNDRCAEIERILRKYSFI